MPATNLSARQTLRLYWLEARFELLKTWRMPAYVLPTPLSRAYLFLLCVGAFDGSQAVAGTTIAGYLMTPRTLVFGLSWKIFN